jgi:transcription initiation factor TFIID TATA-box-binding protein
MRLPPDNTYIAFYKSGKFLITTKDPNRVHEIANRVVDTLHSIDINEEIVKIQIHNIVVMETISLNTTLKNLIANLDPRKSEFEPEQFPALVYKDWGVSFLLFSTGKVIMTGLKDFKDAELLINKFRKVIGLI